MVDAQHAKRYFVHPIRLTPPSYSKFFVELDTVLVAEVSDVPPLTPIRGPKSEVVPASTIDSRLGVPEYPEPHEETDEVIVTEFHA